MLQLNLFHVVLGPEDLAVAYSRDNFGIKAPKNPTVALPPDDEWVNLIRTPCSEGKHQR
jgi:hypothetical protein